MNAIGLWGLGNFEIGTQMSFVRLSSGKFLVIDSVPITPPVKAEIDALTENGSLIEAVITSHPFHTISTVAFYRMYPQAVHYGTPRHLDTIKDIPWAGCIIDAATISSWEPEVIIRIPAGTEFINPHKDNHLSGLFIFHPPSKCLYNNDTLSYFHEVPYTLRMGGLVANKLELGDGVKDKLVETADAPDQFKAFLEFVINEWDFDHICCGHNGVKRGGGKDALRELVTASAPLFQSMSVAAKKKYGK